MNTRIILIFTIIIAQILTVFLITMFMAVKPVSALASDCFVQIATGKSLRYTNVDGSTVTIKSEDNLVLENITSVKASMSVYTERCSGGSIQTNMWMDYLDCSDTAPDDCTWRGRQETGWGNTNTTTFNINLTGLPSITKWSVGYKAAYCADICRETSSEWVSFFYMRQNSNQISEDGKLSAKFTMPWFDGVQTGSWNNPSYSILVGTNPAVKFNRDSSNIPSGATEIPILGDYVTQSDYHRPTSDNHGWRISMNINNFQIPNLTSGTTYYWRIKQTGNSTAGYFPGDQFTYSIPILTASLTQGTNSLNSNLTANVNVTSDKWPITYYFWWNCGDGNTQIFGDINLSSTTSLCGSSPNQTIPNISNNTYSLTHTYLTGYYHPVFLAGYSDGTFAISNYVTIQVNNSISFVPAGTTTSVIFQEKLWVVNSVFYQMTKTSQLPPPIYSSSNGQTWVQMSTVPTLSPYSIQQIKNVVFQNKLWLLVNYFNPGIGPSIIKLYSSSDGINWTDVTNTGNTPQYLTSIHSAGGKLWVRSASNDHLYSSTDGVNWTDIGYTLDHPGNGAVVFQNKLWLINKLCSDTGQTCTFNVYSSTDNSFSWTQVGTIPISSTNSFIPTLAVFTDQTGIEKLWVIETNAKWNQPSPTDATVVYSSADGINWTHTSNLPIPLAYSHISSAVFQNKLWVLGVDGEQQLGTHIFSSTDGINWVAELNPCAGNISLSIPNQTVNISSPVSFTVGGLTNCTNNPIRIFSPSNPTGVHSGGLISICSASGSGCSQSTFTSPSQAGTYNYSATIDFNKNDLFASNEISPSITLTVVDPAAGGGGSGGPTSSTLPGCDDSTINRATGLVTAPTFDPSSKFGTSGACIIDPKAAFVQFKIPTYADLKSIYFDQSKSMNKASHEGDATQGNLNSIIQNDIPNNASNANIFINGNLSINGNLFPSADMPIIVFVKDNLEIEKDITYADNDKDAGLVFIVKGNVNIDKTVTEINALIVSEGEICTAYDFSGSSCPETAVSSPQLVINGSLISLTTDPSKNIKFRRDLTDNTQAAEKIQAQPKYLVILKDLLSGSIQKYTEVR